MTPYDLLKGSPHPLPFELYPYQVSTVNDLATLDSQGLWLDTGTGKTATSTAIALYKLIRREAEHVLVLVPPILITGWKRWLDKVPGITTLVYKGTPKQRSDMNLRSCTFILMSLQIFKRDYDRIERELGRRRVSLLIDEAHSLKNVSSKNYQHVRDFSADKHIQLLSGTPVTSPGDVYAYTKLLRTKAYRSLNHFENVHVALRDFFGNVMEWKNLDLLAENLRLNSVRLLKQDVLKDLPEVTYTPLYYDLAPDHYKLYGKLADEQLLKLGNGEKIDATQATRLYHALQQIVVNYGYFSGDMERESASIELLEEVLSETQKLVVFTNYKLTNRLLIERLAKYNPRFIWGESTPGSQQDSIDTFVNDPTCKALVMNIQAGGVGIDSLQHVCNDVLFIEMPVTAPMFHQAVARVHRAGQKNKVNVMIAVAERTISVRLFRNLMEKDKLVNQVVRGTQDLKDAIFGG
jgi:SNF2 family DNA or RNA helicase